MSWWTATCACCNGGGGYVRRRSDYPDYLRDGACAGADSEKVVCAASFLPSRSASISASASAVSSSISSCTV
uniref:Uncharacterized protein n=1 Tax=Siphoviridae sp. ctPyh10 TaxID=2827865 RepID=A0A8S5SYV4_9CAUD|nr:MAG TPA: hypothetical protein [Siphoviridae sp. ctPyh10]